jgi:RNA polymerase sigma-70 factor (ECF subfamily)
MAPLLARRPAADRSFERLYQRHVKDVYRYVHAVLRNPDDAEDVTQTTFMNAYRAFQRGERPEQPKNWLIAIAHNVCRQRFRQLQRRPSELPLFEDAAEMAVEEPDDAYTAEDIQRALGQLAFNQRAALVMRELEGRSYAEIAEIMGLTVGAVETLIFRGRRALREQLEGQLTCAQAELALSKQTDGVLSRGERGQLRAHLRECKECESLARRQRATRGALKALGAIPLPTSLASFFGGGGSAVTAGVAAKAAAVVFAGSVVGTAGYEGAKHVDVVHAKPVAAAAAHHAAPGATSTRPLKIVEASSNARPVTPAVKHEAKETQPASLEHAKSTPKPKHAAVHGKAHVQQAAHELENPARAQREPENPVRPVHQPENSVARPAKSVHEHPVTPAQAHSTTTTGKKDESPASHGNANSSSKKNQGTTAAPKKALPPVVPTAPKPDRGHGRGGGDVTTPNAGTPVAPTVPAPSEVEPPISDGTPELPGKPK